MWRSAWNNKFTFIQEPAYSLAYKSRRDGWKFGPGLKGHFLHPCRMSLKSDSHHYNYLNTPLRQPKKTSENKNRWQQCLISELLWFDVIRCKLNTWFLCGVDNWKVYSIQTHIIFSV